MIIMYKIKKKLTKIAVRLRTKSVLWSILVRVSLFFVLTCLLDAKPRPLSLTHRTTRDNTRDVWLSGIILSAFDERRTSTFALVFILVIFHFTTFP